MPTLSAGLVVHRSHPLRGREVLIVHPGGPFWAKKHRGAWSIPKGEYGRDEDPAVAARREFVEELGVAPPDGPMLDLGEVQQRGGKRVTAFAIEGDVDVSATVSNTFEMEWPPRSGRTQAFPEVDRAEWCSIDEARERLIDGQVPLLDRLLDLLARPSA